MKLRKESSDNRVLMEIALRELMYFKKAVSPVTVRIKDSLFIYF